MKNKSGELIEKMLVIYKPLNEDWMGFKLKRNNPYTFHHIKEKRHGGRYEIQNGALLTREGHQFLNFLYVLNINSLKVTTKNFLQADYWYLLF